VETGRKNWGLEALVGSVETSEDSRYSCRLLEVEETTVEIRGELLKPVED